MIAKLRSFFRTLSGAFVALGLLALAAAGAVGIGGPQGFPLLLIASACLLLAWVHPWRSPKRFLVLAASSVGGFAAGAFLHNLLYAAAQSASSPALAGTAEVAHVVFFLLAVAVAPVGVAVGLVGAVATAVAAHLPHRAD